MKLAKIVRCVVLSGSVVLMSLSGAMRQAEAQINPGCYYIRSLNNNFQGNNSRYLGVNRISLGTTSSSDGSASVQMISYDHVLGLEDRERYWKVIPTGQGTILRSFKSGSDYFNLDGKSDGRSVGLYLSNNVTHGQYWQIERDGNGYRIKSLNNNFRSSNFRWLDGASDGRTVKLINATTHGTLWNFIYKPCPAWFK